ncbi:MAG: histidinol-phosphate transaminase [Candidatus Omnitrophota bacterium]
MNDIPRLIDKLIKPQVKGLVRIKDTFDDRFDYLRLDKKERLIPFDEKLFAEFKSNIRFEDLSGYAELGETYRKLAAYLKVSEKQVLLASGSDLAIKSVYEACMNEGDNVVLHVPGYAMFRVYANMFGVEARMIPINKDWTLDYDGMLSRVDVRTKMVVIENPNGFVGTKPDMSEIERYAQYLLEKDVLLMLDEAYFYINETECHSRRLIERFPNVILSQTFSKAHGLAGLRVGYLVGEETLIEYISRVRPMHEITSLSACATRWILDHPEILEENQRSIAQGKLFLIDELRKRDIEARDTHANFVMVYVPDEGRTADLSRRLKEEKILVRRPFEESFLKGWSLICVGAEQHSIQLIEAIDKIFQEQLT